MQKCIFNQWKIQKGYRIFSLNTYGLGHEADMLAVHLENNFCVEFEIKRSKSDFLKDFTKTTKHSLLKTGKYPANMFYFVCERGLIDEKQIPYHLGLITIEKITINEKVILKNKKIVNKKKYVYDIAIVKNAKVLHKRKLPDHLIQKILISMMDKYFNELDFNK
jgi:hypothetical protein